jgi:hypothetical protein
MFSCLPPRHQKSAETSVRASRKVFQSVPREIKKGGRLLFDSRWSSSLFCKIGFFPI